MAPRSFERPAMIALPPEAAGEGRALEGLFVPVDDPACGGAVIAPPHPLMGGSMESPVVCEIAYACQRAGLASLRFNWRGVGASAGDISADQVVADVDYRAALEFMRETVSGPISGCGYSFGAAAAIRATRQLPVPHALLLVAPPTGELERELLRAFPNEIFIAVGDQDDFVAHDELSQIAHVARAAHLELFSGCDHFFISHLAELSQAMRSWWQR